jgi:hypothetical protein
MLNELMQSYADVIRTGHLKVNGRAVSWVTDGSPKQQLQNFSAVFGSQLRSSPELAILTDTQVWHVLFLYCKAVSANYALVDVLGKLQDLFGCSCCVHTHTNDAVSLHYGLDIVRQGGAPVLRPWLRWTERDNIVGDTLSCGSTDSSSPRVLGTLKRVDTEFSPFLKPDYVPSYTLQLRVVRSSSGRRLLQLAARNCVTQLMQPSLGALNCTKQSKC